MTTTPDGYGKQLSQLEPWNEMFDLILARHGLDVGATRRMGRAGTFPTAIIGNVIVKLFPEFLSGPECYQAELIAYELLAQADDLPVPQLLGNGSVFEPGDDWHWPYVVLSVVDGVDLTSCKTHLSDESLDDLARWLGGVVGRLHTIEHGHDWSQFVTFMQQQRAAAADRHRRWATLPSHLIDEIEPWLPQVNELMDTKVAPVFVHADIHEDHILGTLEGSRFTSTGVIDFGDVVFAPPMFELPALHLGTFHGNKRLLEQFLDSSAMLFDARTAMALTLMFPFDVLTEAKIPADLASLDELTTWLYGIEQR